MRAGAVIARGFGLGFARFYRRRNRPLLCVLIESYVFYKCGVCIS